MVYFSYRVFQISICTDNTIVHVLAGEKIGEGHICLWCNEKSKTFLSTQAVQKHMRDKGHCKLLFEGDAVFEYSDFYDYRYVCTSKKFWFCTLYQPI